MRAIRLTALGAAALAFTLGISSTASGDALRLDQVISSRVARGFLETVDWDKYEATQINIAEAPAWEDPAVYLDLKEDEWTVEFPNDEFLSHTRRLLGDIADPRPIEGDVQKTAMELLERDLVHVYRVQIGGPDLPDRAIVLTPYTIKALTIGEVIKIKLDDNGLQTREGDLTDGGIDLFRRNN
jgi:hypothetical protein